MMVASIQFAVASIYAMAKANSRKSILLKQEARSKQGTIVSSILVVHSCQQMS